MARQKDSLSLGIRRLETHWIHTGRPKSRSTQEKNCDQKEFGAVKKHGGTLRILTFCAGRPAEKWDLQTIRCQQAPNIYFTSIEHTRKRQNKYQMLFYNVKNNWDRAQVSWKEMTVSVPELRVWSVSWLWNPLCPTPNGHKTFTLGSSSKKQVKQLCHLQSSCYPATTSWSVPTSIWATGSGLCPPPH